VKDSQINRIQRLFITTAFLLCSIQLPGLEFSATAEETIGFFGGEWYVSWGYNRDYYADADIHVSQPSLGNDFTIHQVKANDYNQWDDAQIFMRDFSVPQFNLRVGHFFNQEQDWGIEFSLDHTKFSSTVGQAAHVTGTMNGAPIDTVQTLDANTFRYDLHNGVNHIMFNLVKRYSLLGQLNRTFNLSLMLKGGLGIVLPHADNTVYGNNSDVGPKIPSNWVGLSNGWWELNGWTAGAEVALRFTFLRPLFIEFCDKGAFASLTNVPVYQGRASQVMLMNEWLFDLGVTINPKLGGN
jgi:hypothetical protein